VAAGEDETQPIVFDRFVARQRTFVGDRLDLVDPVLERVEARAPADAVDRLETSGGNEPGARVCRDAFAWPLLERRPERVVQRFLGDVEIPEQPDQRREHASRLGTVDSVERAVDAVDGLVAHDRPRVGLRRFLGTGRRSLALYQSTALHCLTAELQPEGRRNMTSRLKGFAAVAALTIGAALAGAVTYASAQDVTLEVWSHEADEPAKVAFRELAVKNLEKAHPGVKVKITWYEKNPLFAALKTALPAGKGPDVFYLEPDQTEYITAGYIVPLDDLVNWNNIEPWARKVWIKDGKTYGIPQEATPSSSTTTRT
jgi:hypothetical protein